MNEIAQDSRRGDEQACASSSGACGGGRDICPIRAAAWLLVIVLAGFALRHAFANGWAGSDDRLYHAVATRLLSSGSAQAETGAITYDNRAARVSWILAVTGWLAVFGDSEAARTSLDVCCGALCIAALYWAAVAMVRRRVALAAAAILAVYPPALVYNGILFPDHFGSLWMLLAMGAFLRAERVSPGRRVLWIVPAAACLAVAVSAKEPAVVLGVVFPLAGLVSRLPGRATVGVVIAALAVLMLLAVELPVLSWMHGDAWYRFRASDLSFGEGGISRQIFSLQRLSYYAMMFVVRQDVMGVFGWALLAGAVWAVVQRHRFALVLLWTAGVWLFLEFGSSTLTRYSPMPKEGRLMAPIPLLLFVPLADLVVRVFSAGGRARGALAVAAVGLAFHGVFTANQRMEPLYRSDHRASLRAATELAAEGKCPPLIIPEGVVDAVAPEETGTYRDVPTIDLIGAGREETLPERMLFPARGMGLVVPKSRLSFMTQMRMFHAVRPLEYAEYLEAEARSIPLYAEPAPLDRLLLRVSPRRLAEPKVVGHVYVLPD